jgi:hypothetical protein
MPSTHKSVFKSRKHRRAPVGAKARATEERALWALLSNTDARALSFATRKLDRISTEGIRHFSALRRAVPLHLADEATKEIYLLEREIDPCEVALDRPKRKWQRQVEPGST